MATGGSGPHTSPGFGYDPNGGTNWTHPSDPGDGSLFRSALPGGTAPVISSFSPADNATGVAVAANLVATFSAPIARGTGNITVKNLTDGTQATIAVTDTTQVSISGAVLTINPTANLLARQELRRPDRRHCHRRHWRATASRASPTTPLELRDPELPEVAGCHERQFLRVWRVKRREL